MQDIINFILENLPRVILLSGTIVMLVIAVLLIIHGNRKDLKDQNIILGNITTPRIFLLDLGEGKVTYFNRGSFGERKNGLLPQFFQQFTAKEVDRLDKWVNALIDPKSEASKFYKVDVFVRDMRRSYASILEVTGVDYEKKIIHLESYLYRYLKANDQMNLTVKKKENIGYLTEEELVKVYRRAHKRGRGVYGAISIAVTASGAQTHRAEIPPHLWYELQNQVAVYRKRSRVIRFGDNHTVGIYFPRSSDVDTAIDVFQSIKKRMSGYLQKNGYNEYSLGIGLTRSRQFSEMNMFFKTAEELSLYALKEDGRLLIHDPNKEIKDMDLSLYRSELTQLVARKGVDTLFQPIVNAKTVEILGYLTTFSISGSLFGSFNEAAQFARENKQNEQLVKMVLRKAAARYYNMRRNNKQLLFVPLGLGGVDFISDAFSTQPFANDLKMVFMLEEQDFANTFVNIEDMLKLIKKIKKQKYEVCLIISDTELTLPDKIYGEVDYFMVNEKILTHTVNDERERLSLLSSLGKLLRHQKPIMISDLPKWSEIEYYIRAGVDYVASDEISKKDNSLQTIDKKKALRIINFSKRK